MANGTKHGYLVLADISGYTSYVSSTELEHANGILSDLLEVITDGLIPPLTLAKLEGDAVFAHGDDDTLPHGETLLDAVDRTYFAFRDHIEAMRRLTTCECNACRAIPTLDLKFLIHHGEYLIQRLALGEELLGSDVNVVHRLAKNHIGEATGWRAYVLCTQAAMDVLKLPCDNLHRQAEAYEHLGEVETYSYDLRDRYQEMSRNRRVVVTLEEADVVRTREIAAPRHTVWNWLNDPSRMAQWLHSDEVKAVDRPRGRNGVGARNHCMHGKQVIKQTVVDWKPFDYLTILSQGPMSILSTYRLTDGDHGTTMTMTVKTQSRLPSLMTGPICRTMFRVVKIDRSLDSLAQGAEREAAGQAPAALTGQLSPA